MVKGKKGVTMTLPKKLLVPSLIVIKVEIVCLLGICCACSFTMVLILVSPKCCSEPEGVICCYNLLLSVCCGFCP